MTLAQPGTSPSPRIEGARARYQRHGATASPGRSVVLLYERLLRDLDDAALAIGQDRPAVAHEALIHAQRIVEGLDMSLDRDAWSGGPALAAVYDYLHRELVAANVSKDRRRIAGCRGLVEPLADAWRTAWAAIAEGAA